MKQTIGLTILYTALIGSVLMPAGASAAVLYFFPQEEEVFLGESFVSEVRLDTEGEVINAADIVISFPEELIEVIDFSIGGSIFPLFAEGPKISNETGTVSFQAGVPNGYEGSGLIGRMFIRTKAVGEASLSFKEGSQVLLNDGSATPAALRFLSVLHSISEKPENLPELESKSHPDQDRWYSGPFIRMSWEAREGFGYSYILSRSAREVPDEMPDEPIGEIKLTTTEEGIFYFHLRECTDSGCGLTVRRRALKDMSPPELFEVLIGEDSALFDGEKFLSFSTTDAVSGVERYEIAEGSGEWKVVKSPYLLEGKQLQSIIRVKAVDKAGNERIVQFQPHKKPLVSQTFLFVLVFFILVGGYVFWRRKQKKTQRSL